MNLPAMQNTTAGAVPDRRPPLCRHTTSYPRPRPRVLVRAPVSTPAPSPAGKVKFDAAFIERRMAAHQAWRKQQEQLLAAEIINEVHQVFDDEDRFR